MKNEIVNGLPTLQSVAALTTLVLLKQQNLPTADTVISVSKYSGICVSHLHTSITASTLGL